MTRFSVIVPMRSTEAFADECLWSVRRQTGADVEVIAVDDDSPDECGAIADRHARADDRITVVHLARSHGVGPARNAGIARASGEYVLFLDADDAFFDDRVLADLDAVLAATGDPAVLLFDYEEWRPCGLRRRMGLERVVPFDEARLVTAAEHPVVLRAVRDVLAASARPFLRGRTERLSVIPPELLDEYRRRSDEVITRINRHTWSDRACPVQWISGGRGKSVRPGTSGGPRGGSPRGKRSGPGDGWEPGMRGGEPPLRVAASNAARTVSAALRVPRACAAAPRRASSSSSVTVAILRA